MPKQQDNQHQQQGAPQSSSADQASQSSPQDQHAESSPETKTPETSEPRKTALDAVSEALGVKPADGDGDAGESGSDAGTETGTDAGAGDAGAAGADDGAEGADAGETGDAEAGEDNAGEGEDADAATAAAEGEADAEDDFEPPQGLKERSTERWNKLVDRTKEAETRLGSLQKAINDTGAPREDVANALYALRLIHRGGPDGMRQALAILDQTRANVAQALGIEVPGVDLLADFPDLTQAVEGLTMNREQALEIANARRLKAATTAAQQRESQQTETQAQLEQRAETARQQLTTLGTQLQGSDLDYDAKFKILKDNGDITDIMENFPPEKWVSQFQRRYNLLGKVNAKPTKKVTTQPLRTTGTGGGGTPQPKSMLDAITQGITAEE